MKNMNYIKRIKYMVYLIVGFITAILIFILVLLSFHSHDDMENQIMIENFAQQQMLTQIMSKDAGRIYSLYQAGASAAEEEELAAIEQRLKDVKNSLLIASEKFEKNLDKMKKGTFTYDGGVIKMQSSIQSSTPQIVQIDGMWEQFKVAIEELITQGEANEKSLEALVYIQSNNLEMLSLSEEIATNVLRNTLLEEKTDQRVIYLMMALLMVMILVAFKSLHSYIVVPYRQLYQGFEKVGLIHEGGTMREQQNFNPLMNEVEDMFQKINDLFKLLENMNNNYSFTEMLDFINDTFSEFISYNYIGVALIDKEKQTVKATYGVSDGSITGMPEDLMGKTFRLQDTSLLAVIEEGNARIINDLEAYTKEKTEKYYNKVILNAGIKASITLPLKQGEDPIGVIFFSSNQKNVYKKEHITLLKVLANSIAVSFEQNIFIDDLLYSNTLALAKLAEARDEDTGEHLERMKIYSSKMAELLYGDGIYEDIIDIEYISQIERFSPLHDIGKVGVPDGILLKPGKLTTEEFEEMKKHTTYGAEVLRTAEQTISKHKRGLFGIGIEIAEGHQEKWDGSGYPFGKKGNEIPLSARIVAVADVLDALTSERPYKKAFPFETSFQMMVEERGTHFDPVIIDSFVKHKEDIFRIYQKFHHK